jgi:5-methylcytosine-specific restriction endonuclease McrA
LAISKRSRSETYIQVPLSFGDFASSRTGAALLHLGSDARSLRDLHLQMVIYAKTYHTGGFVPDYEVGRLAYPDPPEVAALFAQRLADAGLIEPIKDGYQVHAAEEWPPLWRTGNREQIPQLLRQYVYARDGYRCVNCGTADDLTVDHVIPWSQGGSDTESNLRTYCDPCNNSRGVRQ